MNFPLSQFAFALCQAGAESRLKSEIQTLCPDYRPAFQRPGLVTFKASIGAAVRADEAPPAIFARAWGCSAGAIRTPEDAQQWAAKLGATRVFVGPRSPGAEVPEGWSELSTLFPAKPKAGELVLDVIVPHDEPALLGWHVHGRSRHVTPSGIFQYPVPATAPSRAYGKAVEGLLWSRAKIRAGDVLLEIGAAPGGTTLAYLERGLRVVAVDTQELAPVVREHPGCLAWLKKPISEVTMEDLPAAVQWIALDAGIAPSHAVRSLRRLRAAFRSNLRGLLLTLKLNDAAAVAMLPQLLAELRQGGARVSAIQLPTNRNDIFVYVECPPPPRRRLPNTGGRNRGL